MKKSFNIIKKVLICFFSLLSFLFLLCSCNIKEPPSQHEKNINTINNQNAYVVSFFQEEKNFNKFKNYFVYNDFDFDHSSYPFLALVVNCKKSKEKLTTEFLDKLYEKLESKNKIMVLFAETEKDYSFLKGSKFAGEKDNPSPYTSDFLYFYNFADATGISDVSLDLNINNKDEKIFIFVSSQFARKIINDNAAK